MFMHAGELVFGRAENLLLLNWYGSTVGRAGSRMDDLPDNNTRTSTVQDRRLNK